MTHDFADPDGAPHRVDPGAGTLAWPWTSSGATAAVSWWCRSSGADGMDFGEFHARYDELARGRAKQQAVARRLRRRHHHAENPGTLGTTASVPRLMPGQGTIVATGDPRRRAAAGDDDHLDLRPPRHPGRRVGQLPPPHRRPPAWRGRLLRRGVRRTGRRTAATAGRGGAATPSATPEGAEREDLEALAAAVALVRAYRSFGHLAAHLGPLGTEPARDPALDPLSLGLSHDVMAAIPADLLRIDCPATRSPTRLPNLLATYCGSIAYEVEQIASDEELVWVCEGHRFRCGRDAAGRPAEQRGAAGAAY